MKDDNLPKTSSSLIERAVEKLLQEEQERESILSSNLNVIDIHGKRSKRNGLSVKADIDLSAVKNVKKVK